MKRATLLTFSKESLVDLVLAQQAQIDRLMAEVTRLSGRFARAAIAAGHCPQVQSLDHFHHEPREVALRQPLIDRWWHQEVDVAVEACAAGRNRKPA